ncbi:MAG: hypothetical protein EXS10_09885 [Phycisphaerales bacterium]|nr:hypothetical protein [Phycisphaerales bacterium]
MDLSEGPAFAEDFAELTERFRRDGAAAQLLGVVLGVVLDMSRVSHLVSSNLTQLLQLRKLAKEFHFKIVIVSVPTTLWSVFLTTGLDRLFEFAPDVSTGLAKLTLTLE